MAYQGCRKCNRTQMSFLPRARTNRYHARSYESWQNLRMSVPGQENPANKIIRVVVGLELNFLLEILTVKSVVWRNCTRLRSGAHLWRAGSGLSRRTSEMREENRRPLEQPLNEKFFSQESRTRESVRTFLCRVLEKSLRVFYHTLC